MSNVNEYNWDKLLKIKTSGRDDTKADQYCYPYEPTPYCVLERLANSGYIKKNNCVIDYGCGKGRVDFFLSYQTRCKSVGIEYDERIYKDVCNNQDTAVSGSRTEFLLQKAETRRHDVFLQSIFNRNIEKCNSSNCSIILCRTKTNVVVFLLSVR